MQIDTGITEGGLLGNSRGNTSTDFAPSFFNLLDGFQYVDYFRGTGKSSTRRRKSMTKVSGGIGDCRNLKLFPWSDPYSSLICNCDRRVV